MKSARIAVLVSLVMLLVALLQTAPIHAGSITGSVILGANCTEITASGGGSFVFDRDTSGTGQEIVTLEARDGAGKLLFTVLDTRNVGSTVLFAPTYSFSAAPDFNPITVQLFSPGGNGFGLQIVMTAQGNCPGLPSASGNVQFFDPGDDRLNRDPASPPRCIAATGATCISTRSIPTIAKVSSR